MYLMLRFKSTQKIAKYLFYSRLTKLDKLLTKFVEFYLLLFYASLCFVFAQNITVMPVIERGITNGLTFIYSFVIIGLVDYS